MSLARIITRLPEASRHLAEQLRARGFEVETRSLRDDSAPPTDLEILLEECDVEDALHRASLEAGPHGCVFIGPGAIAQDFRPMAVIPLIPNIAAEAVVEEKSVPASGVSPVDIASEGAPVAHIAEMQIAETLDQTLALAPTSEEAAWEQPVAHSDAASISDLAAQPQTGESDSMEADTTRAEEAPVLLETQTILATETSSAEVLSATPEIKVAEVHGPEVHLSEVQLPGGPLLEVRSEVPQHEGQLVFAQTIADPVAAQPEALRSEAQRSELMQSSELPNAPSIPLAGTEEVAPVVCEERRARPRKTIRISFPRLQRSFYYWGAAALATVIAVEALVLIFAGSTLPRSGQMQSPGQQLPHPQTQSAPAAPAKAGPVSKTTPGRRAVRAADEGYVAKNTVIHYGTRPSTPPAAKSAAKPKLREN